MEWFTWYTLWLKAWIIRKSSWIMLAGMVLVIWIVAHVQIPSADNTDVGICFFEDSYSERFIQNLESSGSVYDFFLYDDEAQMREDILSGHLECGFILDEYFEEKTKSGNIDEIITYVCTPMTAKGESIKETIFAAYLQIYGETILKNGESVIYGDEDDERQKAVLEQYAYYLENSRLFKMETEVVKTDLAALNEQKAAHAYPLQGISGILLFLMLWFSMGRKFEKNGCNVFAALNSWQRTGFEILGNMASITIPAAMAYLMIVCSEMSRGVIKEMAAVILFMIVGSLWVWFVGRWFKNSTSFAAWALTLVLVQIFICPVFIDLAGYVPALSVVRMVFPLSWYLFIY